MAQPALVTSKVSSPDAGTFTSTTEYAVLHCTNVTGNNNKFYCIEIQEDPSTDNYRLFSHYGRLGVTGAYEIRETDKCGDTLTQERCKSEFDKIIKKKQRGKNVKRDGDTIREAYAKVDVVAPTVGSSNICNASSVTVSTKNTPAVNTSSHDSESGKLIKSFVAANIHSITSNTTLTFTSRGFETPLGPVTESHLDRAATALDTIRDELNGDPTLDFASKDVCDMNSEYLTLIPRRVGYKITQYDMVLTPDQLAAEYDMIGNLRTAVQAGLNTKDDTKDDGVNMDIALLDRSHVDWSRLKHKFDTTKHRNHSNCTGYQVKNIFTLDIPKVSQAYKTTEARLGNVEELFHGTKTANMFSISLNGLIIPPTGSAHVTGRMFGNGVYSASCSTKALNYAVGFWGRSNNNQGNKAYVLITQFAMGKTHIAKSSTTSGAPRGYDSIHAIAGHSLLNDEYIVYNLNQANITHILELEK